jgi:endonuclease/exonuclease/phosphatase family metal-dependent hydrolase
MGICESTPKQYITNISKKFSVMSYNVRCGNDTLRNNIDGSIKTRSKYVINNILLYKPDSIGFQEVTVNKSKKVTTWYSLLNEGLKELYTGVGQGRDEGNWSEANPIFFNNHKFDLLEEGTKWLSPTPDVPFTQFDPPRDGCKRILTYAILKNKTTGFIYMHVNTHLDYKFKENRVRQIKVVKDFLYKYKDKYPVILTGDFNSERNQGDAVLYLLDNGFVDSAYEAPISHKHWTFPSIGYHNNVYNNCIKRRKHKDGRQLELETCCGEECDGEHGAIIDYCFKCNNKLFFEKYQVVTDYQACGGISSDHYPIYIEGYFIE